MYQPGQVGKAEGQRQRGQHNPEPVQIMEEKQIADEAGNHSDGVAHRTQAANTQRHVPPHRRLSLLGMGAVVITGGKELVLRYAQLPADSRNQGDVRVR